MLLYHTLMQSESQDSKLASLSRSKLALKRDSQNYFFLLFERCYARRLFINNLIIEAQIKSGSILVAEGCVMRLYEVEMIMLTLSWYDETWG
jgi:hypothetical protein